jgi:chemotaxis signal transduction protein
VNSATPVVDVDPSDPVGATAGAVVLNFGAGRYEVDMAAVAEVATVPPVTLLPRAPAWLTGVANWRGRVLPVLDLRPLLGLAQHSLASSARIVVLAADGVEVAVLAEAVPGVVESATQLLPMPDATASALIAGLHPDPDGPITALDAGAVLALRSQLPPG